MESNEFTYLRNLVKELNKSPEYKDSPGGKHCAMAQKIGEEKSEKPDEAEYWNEKIVSIIIVPPHPWQEVVDKFKEEDLV